jgi:predicted secreted hydrolase
MNHNFKKIDAIIIVILIIIAAVVLISVGYVKPPISPITPEIRFIQDDAQKILKVTYVGSEVLWENIIIDGENFDRSGLGPKVVVGDEITNCQGTITIIFDPTSESLGSWTFTPKEVLPAGILLPQERTIKPADEGEHYKDLLVNREWWYYTTVFSNDCELPGWTLSVSFNHMARNDLGWTKPDMLFVVLTSPHGERYGGVQERERPILGDYSFLKDPVLQVSSSDSGFRITFEDSYVQGRSPNWHLHIEGDNIDANYHDLIIDLQFFAVSSGYWLHNNRIIDNSQAKIASYVFLECEVSGAVEIDGLSYNVKGTGHHEHTWSTGLILSKVLIRGWDWSQITMDNGWNIYYSKYYLTSQLKSSKESNTEVFTNLIITTDQGKTLTILEDVDVKILQSDDVLYLLKIPVETQVKATNSLTQIILNSYNINLDLNIKSDNFFDNTWKKISPVSIRIGRTMASGIITWSDDYGDHEVALNGIGTIWNMRH